jgi:hypothetical protein
MARKAKVTKLADFKKKAGRNKAQPATPPAFDEIMDAMLVKPLSVPSEDQILAEMKNSGHPALQAFADAIEREKKGEKVDFRKFSDL